MELKDLTGKVLFKSPQAKTVVDLLHEAARASVDLPNINLERADLKGLQIGEFKPLNLTGGSLKGADLSMAVLSHCNLTGVNLAQANLFAAKFVNANLSQANLAGANLIRADLSKANLQGANLIGANLTNCNMGSANTEGMKK